MSRVPPEEPAAKPVPFEDPLAKLIDDFSDSVEPVVAPKPDEKEPGPEPEPEIPDASDQKA
jgi:hypothetical protein